MLFKEILSLELPYGYLLANCHNLSHFVYLFLNQKGISSEKIWAFSPSVYAQNQQELISFTDKKNISPSGKIDWGYHVAPVVKVKIKNKIHQMVIDPALFPNRMVSYRTWLSKIRTKKLIYLIMEGQWYLFNSALITHAEFHDIQNSYEFPILPNYILPDWFSDKLITDFFRYDDFSQQDHWLEKGLAINATALHFYHDEVEPLLKTKSDLQKLNNYKNLVGNVFNFETIFRDFAYNFEMDDNFQYQHQSIIIKYRSLYEAELAKWQLRLSEMTL